MSKNNFDSGVAYPLNADKELKEKLDDIFSERVNTDASIQISENQKTDLSNLTMEDRLWQLLSEPDYTLHPKKWVETYNRCKNIVFEYKTDSVSMNGEKVSFKTYMAEMRMWAREKLVDRHLTKQSLEDAVEVWKHNERKKFLSEVRNKLSFVPPAEDLVSAWVRAATGDCDPCDVAVMRHFIWQVRRKLYGLKVEHHMMPILYGKTAGGKSEAVRRLLEPIDDLCIRMDLSVFSDQFRMGVFYKAYVMFFDEMARSDRADIDKLKNIITESTVDYRPMYTDVTESVPQNCTFIGASNEPVHDKIFDPTSARRYWQLNCSDLLDHNAINSIDYLALWKSIDEHSACPVIPVLSEIHEIQHNKIRRREFVEDWLIQRCVPTEARSPKSDPQSEELYNHFKKWCEWQNIRNNYTFWKFRQQLGIALKTVGWSVKNYRTNKGTTWPLEVKLDSSIRNAMVDTEVLDNDVSE